MNIEKAMDQLKNIWREKMSKIKFRKVDKVVLVIIGIVVVFLILFEVFIYDDDYTPGKSCNIVISRITHRYVGTVTHHCSYVDCKEKTKFLSGKLKDSEYKKLKEGREKALKIRANTDLCSLFE